HGDDAGKRRLAATAFPDDRQRLALPDGKAHALHRVDGPALFEQAARDMVVARDVARFEDGGHRGAPAKICSSLSSSEMVGRRPPTAFSGRAERSARV